MTLQKKSFNAAQSLDRAVFKKKPAVFSAEDLNLNTEILKYAIDRFNALLGGGKIDNDQVLTRNSISYASGILSAEIAVANKIIVVNGSPITLPAQTLNFSRAISTSASQENRTIGLYLQAEYVQYVSTQKPSPNEYEFFAGITKTVNDAIASLTNNTIQGGTPITQTLEGLDFVAYTNPSYVFLSDAEYAAQNGNNFRLIKLGTLVLEANANARWLNNVDALTDLLDFSPEIPVSVPTYINRLKQYIDEENDSALSNLNSELANLGNIYASLSGPNNVSGRFAHKVNSVVAENIQNNPLTIIGGGSINRVSSLDPTVISQNVNVAAYYETDTNEAAIFINNANYAEVTFPQNKFFELTKIFTSSTYDVNTTGFRNPVTLVIKYPNGPISNDIPTNSFSPLIRHNKNYIDFGNVYSPNDTDQPLFQNGARECIIVGHFVAHDHFVITSCEWTNHPDFLRLNRMIDLKLDASPEVLVLGTDIAVNTGGSTGFSSMSGTVHRVGKQVTVSFSCAPDNSAPGSRVFFTLPAGYRPIADTAFVASGVLTPPDNFYQVGFLANGQVTIGADPTAGVLTINATFFTS